MKEIKLTQGKLAIVDDEDYEWLNQYKWHYHRGYARRNIKNPNGGQTIVIMHRVIMDLEHGDKTNIDHIDHNRLNNQKINLRTCTSSQNAKNKKSHKNSTSKYLGVSSQTNKYTNKSGIVVTYSYWKAKITVDYKDILIGLFKVELDAAYAYNEAAKKYFGEFSNLNHLPTGYEPTSVRNKRVDKIILQVDEYNNIIKEYKSCSEVAKLLNVRKSSVYAVCSGSESKIKGMKFIYK